ncbi:MAG TPA: hypothetical protein VE971_02890, partial [Candidatus Eisenbacteria bacterium]|nr:hypothetical protein [Candidatus Eisenbacteria bacterium]
MVREYICFIICTYDLTLQQSGSAIQGIRLYVLRKNSHLVTAVGGTDSWYNLCYGIYSSRISNTLIANLMCLDIFLIGCFKVEVGIGVVFLIYRVVTSVNRT